MQNLDFLHEALKKDLRQWAASIYSNVVSTSVLEKSCRCRADKIAHCIILTFFFFLYNCQILILYLCHQHYIFMDFEENVIPWFEQNLWEWDCINLLHVLSNWFKRNLKFLWFLNISKLDSHLYRLNYKSKMLQTAWKSTYFPIRKL